MEEKNYTVNLKEGTISFRVRANEVNWHNNQKIVFFEASRKEGNILIFKDEKSLLKCLYKLESQGEKELSADVASLSNKEDHRILFSWSQQENNLSLYLDNQKIAEKKIR